MIKKYPQNLNTPKKKNQIQSFEPQKMTPAYVCTKISEYPSPRHGSAAGPNPISMIRLEQKA